MEENCVFCKIVRGELPCYKIYEDEKTMVFLDAFPAIKGQTIIIPKEHLAPWLFDIDNETYNHLMKVSKEIAKAVDKSTNSLKTGLVVEGLELDHVHIKIIPLTKQGFAKFQNPDPKPSEEEMKQIAEDIKSYLE